MLVENFEVQRSEMGWRRVYLCRCNMAAIFDPLPRFVIVSVQSWKNRLVVKDVLFRHFHEYLIRFQSHKQSGLLAATVLAPIRCLNIIQQSIRWRNWSISMGLISMLVAIIESGQLLTMIEPKIMFRRIGERMESVTELFSLSLSFRLSGRAVRKTNSNPESSVGSVDISERSCQVICQDFRHQHPEGTRINFR